MTNIPNYAKTALSLLKEHGFEAYLVGGCVRDSLLGSVPKDFDITTNALPHQTMEVFKAYRTIETGIAHGTVTVLIDGEPIEITTYRTDGSYLDNRHPSSVSFVSDITEDLARRDFTMNAIAMDEDGRLLDPFGGENDLKGGIIRCVGEAEERFREDSLRIMRALRFKARLGFKIGKRTEKAMFSCAPLLKNIAAERIRAELLGLLVGDFAGDVITGYVEILDEFLPELLLQRDYDQHSRHHMHTLLRHTALCVDGVRADSSLRMAALLHDIGKPFCRTIDENGEGHFYSHEVIGCDMAKDILHRLRFSNAETELISTLVRHHRRNLPKTQKSAKKMLAQLPPDEYFTLLELIRADGAASSPASAASLIADCDIAEQLAREVLEKGDAVGIGDLKINGHMLIEIGFRGKDIGSELSSLLEMVVDEQIANEKNALLAAAKEHFAALSK